MEPARDNLVLDPDALLPVAGRALQRGNLARAETLCQAVLDLRPGDPHALNMLGFIAWGVECRETALDFFRQARDAAPGEPRVAKNLADAEERWARMRAAAPAGEGAATSAGEKFLLIKAWGSGFWSDVDHLLGALLLAEVTGRTPVVHWGSNSLFSDDPGANAFESFFEPLSRITIDDLRRPGLTYFPAKWSGSNLRQEEVNKWTGPGSRLGFIFLLSRTETVAVSDFHVPVLGLMRWIPRGHPLHGMDLLSLYRYAVEEYLFPRPEIAREVDEFFARFLADAPFIAVHVRGTDKRGEVRTLDEVNRSYFERVERMAPDPSWRVFLLTDDSSMSSAFQSHYRGRLVLADCRRASGERGVHYLAPAGGKTRMGIEVMKDTYLAARANRFLGNGRSNVSCMVEHLKQWRAGDFELLLPSMHRTRNPFLFRREGED